MKTSALKGPYPLDFRSAFRRLAVGTLLVALVVGATALTPAAASAAQDMKEDVIERCKAATLMVFTAESKSRKGDTPHGSGSGYFINSTGLLITNNHVADPTHLWPQEAKARWYYEHGTLTFTVIQHSGTEDEVKYEAMMVYQDQTADQAILQAVDEDGEMVETPEFLRFLPETRLVPNMRAYAFGFPGGDSQKTQSQDGEHPEITVTSGRILSFPRTPGGRIKLIYTDTIVNRGNSGGPMVNLDGFLVGTATLKSRPEDREITGGAHYSALVPATVSKEMVNIAFFNKKIWDRSDVTPFIDVLIDDHGRINIPEFPRRPKDDILVYEEGDRVYGEVATDKITWNSPFGTLEVPTDAIAYVITDDEGAHLYLEGGNRIEASEVGSRFEFTPQYGTKGDYAFDDVKTVAFRTKDRHIEPLKGTTLVLDANQGRLILKDLKGKLNFESRAGRLQFGLDEISRIDLSEEDEQVVTTTQNMRISGQFDDAPIEAVIASTGTPIRLQLGNVNFAVIEEVDNDLVNVGGLSLLGVLRDAGKKIRGIAKIVESDDPSGAKPKIEELLDKSYFKSLTEQEKEQVYLLDGASALRSGEFARATSGLRKAQKAKTANIAVYASAIVEVLRRFPDYEYKGKSISDRAVFAAAGEQLGSELIEEVRDVISNAKRLTGKKGEYTREMAKVRKYEKLMSVAGILKGDVADDEKARLWKLATELCTRELRRLDEEEQEKREEGQERGSRRGGGRGRRSSRRGGAAVDPTQRAIDEIGEQRQAVEETYREYYIKWRQTTEGGFRPEDPDIQKWREQKPGEDENEEDEP